MKYPKFTASLLAFSLLVALLSGCGSAPAAAPTAPPAAMSGGEQEAVIREDPAGDAPENRIPEAYRAILDKYSLAVSEEWNAGQLLEEELNILCTYCYEGTPTENIGYLLRDLDGDGVQELLIGTIGGDNFTDRLLFDLYTLRGEEAAVLFQGWERSRYFLLEDGRFYNYGSSSAEYSSGMLYTLSGGDLLFSEGMAILSVADGVSEYYSLNAAGECGDLLPEEDGEAGFAAWRDARIQPDFTPLAEYIQ